jgi:DNA (cytosine-5)-methyltransferase 1
MNVRVVDFFSGIGGLSLGAARAGFQPSMAIDIDRHAMEAHSRNFPRCNHFNESICDSNVLRALEKERRKGGVLGFIGGPPCQGFSDMGRRSVGDERNGLFVEFASIAASIRPDFFLMENVPGLLRQRNLHIYEDAASILGKAFNVLPPMVLAANEYGVPTSRSRVFLLGFRKGGRSVNNHFKFPPNKRQAPTVSEALSGLPRKVAYDEGDWIKVSCVKKKSPFFSRVNGARPSGVGSAEHIEMHKKGLVHGGWGTAHTEKVAKRFSMVPEGGIDSVSRYERLARWGLCPTLRAGTGRERGAFQAARPIHPTENRVITAREAARLQGFPDWFYMGPNKYQSFRRIGNSVCPPLSEAIFNRIQSFVGSRM